MSDKEAIVEDVNEAVKRHDLEAMMASFSHAVEIRFPCHPQRPTVGYEQSANAWKGYFRNVQELRSTVATAQNGNEAWSEWHWWGKRDGADWDVRGVIVWTVEQDKIIAGRNYMEPVEGEPRKSTPSVLLKWSPQPVPR